MRMRWATERVVIKLVAYVMVGLVGMLMLPYLLWKVWVKIINKEIKMGRILCWFGIHKWGTYTKGYGNFATISYQVCGRCWKRE